MSRPIMAAFFGIIGCGAGQIYNQEYKKGAFFIVSGLIINQFSNLNEAILLSFQGNIVKSSDVINYQWGLYYLSFYLGSMCEAYIESYRRVHSLRPPALHALPFILGVMFGVIGIIYGKSSVIGPIFMGLLFTICGILLGVFFSLKFSKS